MQIGVDVTQSLEYEIEVQELETRSLQAHGLFVIVNSVCLVERLDSRAYSVGFLRE